MSFLEYCLDNNIKIKQNEIMSSHTSFKIGGAADYYLECGEIETLKTVIKAANEYKIPYFILGKGTNILVSDNGFRGLVICLAGFDKITRDGLTVTAGAGVSIAKLCMYLCENSLSGLTFAYGIPGSVGGALYMNAGAYGGEISQFAVSATVLDKSGNIKEILKQDMNLGYRTSIFKTDGDTILSVKFALKQGEKDKIKAEMDDYMSKRKSKQPLEYGSAGSTFKRPEGYFAGTLIENAGLKGVTVGGAMVSEKHAGFIINYDNATANDVKELMKKVQTEVYKKYGVNLEPEVILVGE